MTSAGLQGLGLVAGCVVTAAVIPRIVDIAQDVSKASGESCLRNLMFVVGNVLWVVYGYLADATAITIMCGINTALNAVVLWAAIHSNQGQRKRGRSRVLMRSD